MDERHRAIITKMIDYANDSREFNGEITYETFVADKKLVGFTVFSLLQIGELVAKLDEGFKEKHPLRWTQMKALRNRIVHHYEGINLRTVWDIVQDDIPTLIEELTEILDS